MHWAVHSAFTGFTCSASCAAFAPASAAVTCALNPARIADNPGGHRNADWDAADKLKLSRF